MVSEVLRGVTSPLPRARSSPARPFGLRASRPCCRRRPARGGSRARSGSSARRLRASTMRPHPAPARPARLRLPISTICSPISARQRMSCSPNSSEARARGGPRTRREPADHARGRRAPDPPSLQALRRRAHRSQSPARSPTAHPSSSPTSPPAISTRHRRPVCRIPPPRRRGRQRALVATHNDGSPREWTGSSASTRAFSNER